MKRMARLFDGFERLLLAVCALLLLVIATVVLWQVVSRYIAGTSATWAPEVATIAFVWLSMLAIAVGVRWHRHLRIDLVGRLATSRVGAALINGVAGLVVVVSFGFLAYYGAVGLEVAMNRSLPGTGFSFAWVASAVPVGAAIALVFAIETLLRDLQQDQVEEPDNEEEVL